MKIDSHNINIVKKPWGYEYLVYQSKQVALWFLYILNNHQTSLHCHSEKTTGLIILDGEAEVSFFADTIKVSKYDKVMIRKGMFHSTKSISQNGTMLFEIETPNNKLDLVRFEDAYGREGKPYENSNFEFPKKDDCIWITPDKEEKFKISDCNLEYKELSDLSIFNDLIDETNVMFLSGGIKTNYGVTVINQGDILNVGLIKKLTKVFDIIVDSTYVLIFN
jgi:mannose-6-phosphate isomerase-like protein (cupin superfamily)